MATGFVRFGDHLINLKRVDHIEHDDGAIHFFFKNGKQVMVVGDYDQLCKDLEFVIHKVRYK